jgi:hypothetical protein
MVAVAIPQGSYLIAGGEAASTIGRRVDIQMTYLFVDIDGEFQTGTPIVLPDNADVNIVTEKVIEGALIVQVAPVPDGTGMILTFGPPGNAVPQMLGCGIPRKKRKYRIKGSLVGVYNTIHPCS